MMRRKLKHTIFEIMFGLIFIALFSVLYYFVQSNPFYHDLSHSRHTLTTTTQTLVQQFSEPLILTLHSFDVDTYHQVKLLIERYQKLNPHFQLLWERHPLTHKPDQFQQSLILKYQDNEQVINLDEKQLSESILTAALFTLQRKANQWIVFLQGHDEPSPFGSQQRDFNLWRLSLSYQGLKTQRLQLTIAPFIPENTQVLVIASPKSTFSTNEQELILAYLKHGGDLLWLIDPSNPEVPFLNDYLGVHTLPGTIVDLHGQKIGTPHPAITIIEHYPELPFNNPSTLLALPFACALKIIPSDFTMQPLLLTNEFSWTESNVSINKMAFEPEKQEVAGPLLVAASLTRIDPTNASHQQRVVVIGNSRFLSNSAIENYGNLSFGLNVMNWLAHDDPLVNMTQPTSQDALIQIHLITAIIIQYGFPLGAFLSLLMACFYHYRRHQKSNKMATLLSRA